MLHVDSASEFLDPACNNNSCGDGDDDDNGDRTMAPDVLRRLPLLPHLSFIQLHEVDRIDMMLTFTSDETQPRGWSNLHNAEWLEQLKVKIETQTLRF